MENGLPNNLSGGTFEAQDGAIWCGFLKGGVISRFDGQAWQTYTSRDGLPEDISFVRPWQTKDGTIWASGGKGTARIVRFDGRRWHVNAPEALSKLSGNNLLVVGTPTHDGGVWFLSLGSGY